MNANGTGAMVAPAGVLHNVSSVRGGVAGAQSELEGVALDLSIAEGIGEPSDLDADARRDFAGRALAGLDTVIATLTEWRGTLAAELGESAQPQDQPMRLPTEFRAGLEEASRALQPEDDTPRQRVRRLFDDDMWAAMPEHVKQWIEQLVIETEEGGGAQ